MPDFPRPKRVLTILGMHRSGTSCLTGSLEASGLQLGSVYAPAVFNKKGNQENPEIVELHEKMLLEAGGSWDNPIPKCDWSNTDMEEAKKILEEYSNYDVWGFKDPRTLMTISGWEELVPDLEKVGIFRHPLSVAKSLSARNQFSVEKALKIWFKYNSLLLKTYQKKPFSILCFDDSRDEFLASVKAVVSDLGLSNVGGYSDFYTDELRSHNERDVKKLPAKVLELYTLLKKNCV